jgi:acyl transferase domain-containing protein
VKSNLGHTQAAAGAAGLMKLVLAMRHEVLPRTLHAEEPSPHIDWTAGRVRLLTEPVPWPAGDRPRRAAVSGFGISGTNAHVVIEEPPVIEGLPAASTVLEERTPVLAADARAWPVSGRTAEGLAGQAGRLREFSLARPDLDPADVGWSLVTTRATFAHRAVAVGAGSEELAARLAAVATGQPDAGAVTGTVPAGGPGKVVFVFPGQGSQWAGMGRQLLDESPVFAAKFAECAAALRSYVDWDPAEALAGAVETADVLQPVLWAIMVSLAEVWRAAGITPDAVVGHSQGEIAAACVAGILSLDAAARVVALRSRALSELDVEGGLLSVVLPVAEVRSLLEPWDGRLSVAAVNSPAATVVSGAPPALVEFERELRKRKVLRWRIPQTDFVAHSALCEPIEGVLADALAGLSPVTGDVPFFSTVRGSWVDGTELDAGYWYANVRRTVRFADAVAALAESGHRTFVEVSAHPVLTTAVEEVLEPRDDLPEPVLTGTLRRDDGGAARMLASLAQVHVHGLAVDWPAVFGGGQRVDLPTYAFQHRRYWPRPNGAVAGGAEDLGLSPIGHPLLGAAIERADGGELVGTGRLSLRTHPWLADHAVRGAVILPGAAFAELALAAADRAGCGLVEDLTLEAPLTVPGEGAVSLQAVVAAPDADGRRALTVYSRPGEDVPWTRHASGVLAPAGDLPAADPDFAQWPPADAEPVDITGFYTATADGGYGLGPAFQGLKAVWRRGTDVFAEVELPEDTAADAAVFGVHPALLDAAQQAGVFATGGWDAGETWLSFGWTGLALHAAHARAARVRLRRDPDGGLSMAAADVAGAPVFTIDAVVMRRAAATDAGPADRTADALFGIDWTPVRTGALPSGPWVVLGDDAAGLVPGLLAAGVDVRPAATLAEAAEASPEVVLAALPDDVTTSVPDRARRVTASTLGLVQEWLAEEDLEPARLVLVTRAAVAVVPGEAAADLAGAAVWGLVRSAQSENPDRLVLADLPREPGPAAVVLLAKALASREVELAVRDGVVLTRRLARPSDGLAIPAGDGPWRLERPAADSAVDPVAGDPAVDPVAGDPAANLAAGDLAAASPADPVLVPCPDLARSLQAGEVRVAVRAAVLDSADLTRTGPLGRAFSGVVAETGSGVRDFEPGDRVRGAAPGAAGTFVVTTADQLALLPEGCSFVAGAAGPGDTAVRVRDVRRALADGKPGVVTIPAAPRVAGTVLITGGTGTLGGVVARHLADAGWATGVLLTSRSGPGAAGVAGLAAGLADRGVEVGVTACDAADPAGLGTVLGRVPALTGVVHAAGVLDDGVIGSLTGERVHTVMRPKADAAWHLDRLTRDRDLDLFVLFSSAAATLGAPGQGNYAAANGFLDAVAANRRAAGLPAVSLTWGLWADAGGMTEGLSSADRAKFARTGIGALATGQGLALLDLALRRDEPLLAPLPLDVPTLRAITRAGGRLPAVLHGLAPVARVAKDVAPGAAGPALRARLAEAGPAGREPLVLELVREQAAAVLGHGAPDAVEIDTSFLEQGLDSLTAVEFRNRLATVTGLRLTGALAFDHPTPAALAAHLVLRLADAPSTTDKKPEPAESLVTLYRRAAADGRAAEVMGLVRGLAAFREKFTEVSEVDRMPSLVPVSRGPASPALICVPSFAGTADAREFARFGSGFRGRRPVSALPVPGFAPGERLAATPGALVGVYAETVRKSLNGAPFALAGYSSGGLVAHALAARLADLGAAPAAVVLIDTFTPESAGVPDDILAALPGAVLAGGGDAPGGDGWLTALAHYYAFDWRGLPRLDVPALLVRAADPVPGSTVDETGSTWEFSRVATTLSVPGDHFTMMREHAETTARAVEWWLAEQQGGI